MSWVEVVKWNSFDTAVSSAARRIQDWMSPPAALAPPKASVPICRCAGQCHCGTMVPYLLQRQIELECEFFREVH